MEIRIDAPGAGDWVMKRAQGFFTHGRDHSITVHNDLDDVVGGFVIVKYMGQSGAIHMAGEGNWCSRELMWMVFHYAFNQCGYRKLLAPVKSDMYDVISMDLRAGWRLEATFSDVFEDDAHLLILSMTKETCPWLDHTPEKWRANT
jgi:hypothetical protein